LDDFPTSAATMMEYSPTPEKRTSVQGRDTPMKIRFEEPTIQDFGSIAQHTFTRCNPSAPPTYVDKHGNVHQTPQKDFIYVPHHIDNFGECSSLAGGAVS
jgi:hypothetical protein